MKARFLVPLLTLTLTLTLSLTDTPLRGQEQDPATAAGFLQVINLVSRKSPTTLSLEGFQFNRGEPVAVGDGSGTLALRPGEFTLELRNPGAKPDLATLPITVENGKSSVVICYDEIKVRDNGEEEVKLRFSLLTEAPEADVAKLTIVSLLREETLPLSVEGSPYLAAPKSPLKIDIAGRETVAIRSGSDTLIDFESERPGHYLVFLYEDPETGDVAASLIQNEKLEYHPPLEEDDKN